MLYAEKNEDSIFSVYVFCKLYMTICNITNFPLSTLNPYYSIYFIYSWLKILLRV